MLTDLTKRQERGQWGIRTREVVAQFPWHEQLMQSSLFRNYSNGIFSLLNSITGLSNELQVSVAIFKSQF